MVKDGIYEIDSNGMIWRLKKYGISCERKRAETENGGYFQVHLRKDGNHLSAQSHRVVWTYFHEKIPDGVTINHIDGNKLNNHPSNLELATYSEQVAHANKVLGIKVGFQKGNNRIQPSLTDDEVIIIRSRSQNGETIAKLSRDFKVSRGVIHNVVTYKSYKNVFE